MALDPYAAAIVGIVNDLVQMNCVHSVPLIKQNSRSLFEFVGIEGHIGISVPCRLSDGGFQSGSQCICL